MKIAQTRSEMSAHLNEQIAFLRLSAAAYDQGFEGEAKRLATTLRILLHDRGGSSIALLTSLGVKDRLRFYDQYADGTGERSAVFIGIGMCGSPQGMRYIATLAEPKETSSFEKWWAGIGVRHGDVIFRRSDIIRSVADMDGGAHVDPKLNADYAALSREYNEVWHVRASGAPGVVENGPHLPIVRQCAFEVALTLERQLPELLKEA